MAKTIRFDLSLSGIRGAISELNACKQDIRRKTEAFRKRFAEEVAALAQSGFDASYLDYQLDGETTPATVAVDVTGNGNSSFVTAYGEDAVWIEFGAGVYYNGSAGSSPNPLGQGLGYTIGSYGKGMGKQKVWGYYRDGELILTHGTPATMPMYNALKQTCDNIWSIAREVFGA